MNEEQRRLVNFCIDMLNGNISRMCVTQDEEEHKKMAYYAQVHLDKIINMTSKEEKR